MPRTRSPAGDHAWWWRHPGFAGACIPALWQPLGGGAWRARTAWAAHKANRGPTRRGDLRRRRAPARVAAGGRRALKIRNAPAGSGCLRLGRAGRAPLARARCGGGGVGRRAGEAAVLGAGRDRFRPSGGRIRVAVALATELRVGEVRLFGGRGSRWHHGGAAPGELPWLRIRNARLSACSGCDSPGVSLAGIPAGGDGDGVRGRRSPRWGRHLGAHPGCAGSLGESPVRLGRATAAP